MRPWLREGLLSMAVIGICWVAAVGYWRGANRIPSTIDAVWLMLALPLALLTALWYGRRVIAKPAPAAATAPTAAPVPAAPAEPPGINLLYSACRVPHGDSADALAAALERGDARAILDPVLTGDDGYPVMSARTKGAHPDAVLEWLQAAGVDPALFNDEQLRALSLGADLATELAGAALDGHGEAPSLRLLTLLPAAWGAEQRRAAGQFLSAALAEGGWPAQRTEVLDMPGGAGAALAALAAGNSPLSLLLACASHIGDDSLAAWSDALTVYTAAHQQGLIPGEGAAGLLAGPGQGALSMHSLSGRRATSADISRKPDASLLCELAAKLMAPGAAKVGAIVADTGHRTSRVMELMALARTAAPHIDTGTGLLCIGRATGTCGDAAVLAALALAATRAAQLDAPVLCVSNEDEFQRCVILVRPPASKA